MFCYSLKQVPIHFSCCGECRISVLLWSSRRVLWNTNIMPSRVSKSRTNISFFWLDSFFKLSLEMKAKIQKQKQQQAFQIWRWTTFIKGVTWAQSGWMSIKGQFSSCNLSRYLNIKLWITESRLCVEGEVEESNQWTKKRNKGNRCVRWPRRSSAPLCSCRTLLADER